MPNKNKSSKPDYKEYGSSESLAFGNSFSWESETFTEISMARYTRMVDNDGMIEALYNVITQPILGAGFAIIPNAEESGEETPQADLVNRTFINAPHSGGMSTPFDLVLENILSGLLYGFACFEKVWQLTEDGYVIYRKISPRKHESITLKRDKKGGFDGFEQQLSTISSETVHIPVDKSFLFTNRKSRNFLYGRSIFKAAHYHYDKKHKLIYLSNIQAQANAITPVVAKKPQSIVDSTETIQMNKALDKLGQVKRATVPHGTEIEWMPTSTFNIMPYINYHDNSIARSVLAQFLTLGDNSGGAYALSKDQSDIFIIALQSVMRNIETHINTYLIAQLIDFNFAKPLYPTFKFNDLSREKIAMLKEVFTTLYQKNPEAVPNWFVEGSAQSIADHLDIQKPDDYEEPEEPAAPAPEPEDDDEEEGEENELSENTPISSYPLVRIDD